MLVLTRRLMEKLYIGHDICVTVVRLEGGQVRLGIEAPRDVPIVRAELQRESKTIPESVPSPLTEIDPQVAIRTRPIPCPGSENRPLGRSR